MQSSKILVRTMQQAEELIAKYGSAESFFENCDLTPKLRKEMEEIVERRKQEMPEVHNYDILSPGPHKQAMEFHNSTAFIKVAIGGNRSSKSYTIIMEAVHHLLGEYPDWWTGYRYYVGLDGQEPLRIRLCGSTYDRGIADVIIPTLVRLLPKGYIRDSDWIRNQNQQIIGAHTVRGDYIQFMTYKQECETYESDTFDLVGHDEPPPLAIFQANCARVIDQNGYVMVGATVLRRHAWLHDELDRMAMKLGSDKVRKWTFKTEDNPTMTAEKLHRFESMMLTPEERDARMFGIPMHHSGRVFKEFQYGDIVTPTIECTNEISTLTNFIDPHERKSWVLIWVETNSAGNHSIGNEAFEGLHTYRNVALQIALVEKKISFDELKQAQQWEEEAVKKLLRERFYSDRGRYCSARVMDTSGWKPDPQTGLPWADMLREYGIYCLQAQKRGSENMITKLRSWMAAKPVSKLTIQQHCKETIWQVQNCCWKDYVNEHLRFRHDLPAVIEPKRSDIIDLLRYLARYDPQYTPHRKQDYEEIEYEGRMVNEFAGIGRTYA